MPAVVTPAHQTTKIILGALKSDQTPEQWESDFVSAGVSWDDLAIRAIVFGLAPALHHRFSDWGISVPSRAAAKLNAIHRSHAERNQRIAVQLGEVLESCKAAGLHPIALKGVHLAALVYPAPALRPMNDIDLLFPQDEIVRAEALLRSLGYGGKHKPAEMGAGVTKHTSTFRKAAADSATPNPYLSTESEAMIEPHTSLEESWFGLKVDITPGVRERARQVTLSGQPCGVLEPTDLLLHLCMHFSFHLIMGAPSMVQLMDIAVVLEQAALDWDAFVARATGRRAAPFALTGLTLAKKILQPPLSNEALHSLEAATPAGLAERIAGLNLSHILKRTQQVPLTTFRQRLQRGFSDRRETALWAPDFRARAQVWSTLLAFWRTDTGRMFLQQDQ